MLEARDRPENEIEITDAMIEAGESVFWQLAEDRYSNRYDPKPLLAALYIAMRSRDAPQ